MQVLSLLTALFIYSTLGIIALALIFAAIHQLPEQLFIMIVRLFSIPAVILCIVYLGFYLKVQSNSQTAIATTIDSKYIVPEIFLTRINFLTLDNKNIETWSFDIRSESGFRRRTGRILPGANDRNVGQQFAIAYDTSNPTLVKRAGAKTNGVVWTILIFNLGLLVSTFKLRERI